MAYSHYRIVTIDHTQVGSSDLTNFPVLLNVTAAWLATVANGGDVQNSSGFDIVVTSDAAGTTLLKFERVLYVASTGQLVLFVKVPTVSHTTNVLIYLQYSDATVTTDQSDPTNVWDANFLEVLHLGEAASPYADSTSHASNASATTAPTQVAGLFGNAQSYAAASSQFITTAAPSSALAGGQFTISCWQKSSSTTKESLLWDGRNTGSQQGLLLDVGITTGFARIFENATGAANQSAVGSVNLADGNWHLIAGGYDGSAFRLFVDGVNVATTTHANGSLSANAGLLGKSSDATPLFGTATVQEFSYSKTYRSADWNLASYNNQKSGSTFLTLSADTTQTQSGVGRISSTVAKTGAAVARVQATAQQNQASVARVGASDSRNLAALARVAEAVLRTESALARVQESATRTRTALARVTAQTTQDQGAAANIFYALSERGGIDYDQIRGPARHGPGSQFQMHGGGSTQAGHAAVYDSTGDTGDAGAPPALVVTAPASHTDGGIPGQVAYDGSGNYYWCYAADSWARVGPGGWSNSF